MIYSRTANAARLLQISRRWAVTVPSPPYPKGQPIETPGTPFTRLSASQEKSICQVEGLPKDCLIFSSPQITDASSPLQTRMPADFRTYLSTQIVSEQNTVSYRNVSRALRVHVNAAKCMLYEYYADQNKRKPGSVYATYLLAGTKKREEPVETNGKSNGVHHDEDEPMPSSPPPFTSSMLEPSQQDSEVGHEERHTVPVKTVTLVREEALDGKSCDETQSAD